MNRAVLFGVALFLTSWVEGQGTFNIRQTLGHNTLMTNVWETDYGYLVGSVVFEVEPFFHPELSFAAFNTQGEFLYEKRYGDTVDEMLCNPSPNGRINDTTFVIAVERGVNNIVHCGLIWLNTEGDTPMSRNYPSPYLPQNPGDLSNWMVPTYLVSDDDGNIYISCAIANSGTNNDFCILKILPNGDPDWTYLVATDDDPDLSVAMSWHDDKLVVARLGVDDTNMSAQFSFFSLNSDGQVVPGGYIETSDLNIGYTKEFEWDSEGNIVGISDYVGEDSFGLVPTVFSCNMNNMFLWNHPFGNDFGYEQRGECLVRTQDDKFVALGRQYETIEPSDSIEGVYNWNAWMVKCDEEGNFEWQRSFHFIESVQDYHKVYDMKATSDGGFIFCGEAADLCYTEDCIVSQQGWLVKVDSWGCLVPGCQVGILENEQTVNFITGPNPVSDLLNIYFETLNPQKGTFSLFDMDGRKMRSFDADQSLVTYVVDVSDLAQGMYILSYLSESGGQMQQKIVITH